MWLSFSSVFIHMSYIVIGKLEASLRLRTHRPKHCLLLGVLLYRHGTVEGNPNFSPHLLISLKNWVLYFNSKAWVTLIIHEFNIWRITEFREVSFYGLFFQIKNKIDQWTRIGYLPSTIIWNSDVSLLYSYIQIWHTIYITNKNKLFGPLKITI